MQELAALRADARLLWHKIMLLTEVDSIKIGRPSYSHMVNASAFATCAVRV
jgi:hypothetical protein